MIDYIIKVLYGQIIYKITYLMEQYEFLVITQNCKKEEKKIQMERDVGLYITLMKLMLEYFFSVSLC